jgi:hypothetical protein
VATRPVFVPKPSATQYVREIPVDFEWFPGMAVIQKQRSIDSLHAAARSRLGVSSILEISSKSRSRAGVLLSAFNLRLPVPDFGSAPVEVAYQASKRFEKGGPFLELFSRSARDAKADQRLRTSGRLTGFEFGEERWPLEPKSVFYDWLYLNALRANSELALETLNYDAFTDIEFNPEKSVSCQARAASLYASLYIAKTCSTRPWSLRRPS